MSWHLRLLSHHTPRQVTPIPPLPERGNGSEGPSLPSSLPLSEDPTYTARQRLAVSTLQQGRSCRAGRRYDTVCGCWERTQRHHPQAWTVFFDRPTCRFRLGKALTVLSHTSPVLSCKAFPPLSSEHSDGCDQGDRFSDIVPPM